ncbi:hemerythrin family protein [Clostridium sp. C2-6-12]|uniref:bacteriohemerythrin n=1 Tax=Clostridium sp. C2-6-12 TaxID=2698832 RepID=UPI00136B13EE|nr:hemerythrin family protein [Clostridium sp. C2-6-12]
MSLKWDDSLLTGIEDIDSQHKELFKYLDKFLSAMRDGKGKEEIGNALNFLEEYVIKHFNYEEEIQKKYGYPRSKDQISQHEYFKNELKQLRLAFDRTGESIILALNVQNKITDWVKNHISKLDKDLAEYIKNKK